MLTDLDETLFHQLPQPFSTVATSDHRFFDRFWFCGADPTGGPAFFAGFGRYPNMGTQDGFLCLLDGGTQHNLRVATQKPVNEGLLVNAVGPLRVEILEPYRHVALTLNTTELSAQLQFRTTLAPRLERQHTEIRNGRVLQEQQRYVQVGRWDGVISVHGKRYEVTDWWGDRDHAWGVRVDVGGLEPPDMSERTRSLTVWCSFSTASCHGMFQLREYADQRPRYIDGTLYRDGKAVEVVGIDPQIEFVEGTATYREATIRLHLEDGTTTEVVAEPLTECAWAGRGGGYSRGFRDGRGFGARRGEVVEYDVYDVSDAAQVLLDGMSIPGGHREQIARLTVDGEPGVGHLPIMDRSGRLPG